VFVEGPYGILTGARRTRQRVLLIAGGIGITPMRALLEALPARPGDLTLLYRVRHEHDVVFREELEALARIRGAEIRYLPGHRQPAAGTLDPLGPSGLRALVPDVSDRDVFVCGPVAMMQHVESSLRRLGLPSRQIHAERFAY
jgi:ferredoxin-NADP reductase